MSIALITGSAGLIGSASCRRFHNEGLDIVGIDNDMRSYFFGANASTKSSRIALESSLKNYKHHAIDIRNKEEIENLFQKLKSEISVVVHTAAQPSHDWAAKEPHTDFGINAIGTLNLLEATRQYCPEAVFIFTSTNKVYGDTPNRLPLIEKKTRWEVPSDHPFFDGIDETMSIDQTTHSIFGVSKVSGDVLVQEYGRYFGIKTVCFRGGCLTGPSHAGAELHGFLSYLMKCVRSGKHYNILGYKGKQVRDNIHSDDLVEAFWQFYQSPKCGEVYNIGGSRHSNCSMLEAIKICEEICDRELDCSYAEENRIGDHIWWISDVKKFQSHYPKWEYRHNLRSILEEINDALTI